MINRIIVTGKNSAMPRLTGPLYDATAERWISPPSGATPDAGGAADLRRVAGEENTLFSANPLPRRPVAFPPREATGHWEAVIDCITTVAGLLLFSAVAALFLVLA